jgi:hypothetical protein
MLTIPGTQLTKGKSDFKGTIFSIKIQQLFIRQFDKWHYN